MKVNVADGHAKLFVGGYYLRIKSKNELEEWIRRINYTQIWKHEVLNCKYAILKYAF